MLHVSAKDHLISKANFSCSRLNQKKERFFLFLPLKMGQIKKSKSICYINPFVFWFVWEQENLLSKLTDLYYAYNPIFFYCLSFPPYFYHFLRGERVAELSWTIMNFRLQKYQWLKTRWNFFSFNLSILVKYHFGLLLESNVFQNFGLEWPQIHKKSTRFQIW